MLTTESSGLLSRMVEAMFDGVSVVDASGEQSYVNDALCAMLGFSRDELLGKHAPYPYWPVEELPNLEAAVRRSATGRSKPCDLVLQRKNGERFHVTVATVTLTDEAGAVVARCATIKDISEQKRVERSLREAEERWRSIAENPFDFVVVIDREHRYTYVNHTAPGLSRESLIGRATPFDFVDAKHHDAMRAAFEKTFRTGEATAYDVHVPQLDAWYASVVGAVVEHGQVTGLSILTRDITEQKRTEEELKRTEQRLRDSHKIETLGMLAGGIAHDINNVLTPIVAYSELAQRELSSEHRVQEYLDAIRVASHRASDLVRRVLLFSRRQEPKKATVDLRDIVRSDTSLVRASLPATIELVIDVPDEPFYVLADPAQLGQVLANLVSNALQALEQHGGRVAISLRRAESGVVLSVTDNGPGMDAETQRRAFEPFFTTKPLGAGTGLGLSIVHGVVREHGGEVELRSAPGEGTAVMVHLPSGPALAAETPRRPHRATGQGLRVLLVDDEAPIAKVASEILRESGHTVTALTSPEAALEVFTRAPDTFDVLLSDESMPKMTGTALIAALRRTSPALKVVLMTGRDDEDMQRRAASLRVLQVLAKPFGRQDLLDAIEAAGDGAAPPRAADRG